MLIKYIYNFWMQSLFFYVDRSVAANEYCNLKHCVQGSTKFFESSTGELRAEQMVQNQRVFSMENSNSLPLGWRYSFLYFPALGTVPMQKARGTDLRSTECIIISWKPVGWKLRPGERWSSREAQPISVSSPLSHICVRPRRFQPSTRPPAGPDQKLPTSPTRHRHEPDIKLRLVTFISSCRMRTVNSDMMLKILMWHKFDHN
jgi:hypothetical protein